MEAFGTLHRLPRARPLHHTHVAIPAMKRIIS